MVQAHRQWRDRIDTVLMVLRTQVHQLFVDSRSSAGSRSIMGMMREEGSSIGRFKIGRLMAEFGLICKQPRNRSYKQATVECVDILNHLNRQFDVEAPNHVWCGGITFVWKEGRWHYLAVLDLFTRRIVGWASSTRLNADPVVQAVETAFGQRGRPSALMFHSDQGSQYASRRFDSGYDVIASNRCMSRGNCCDNSPMERVFRSLKTEWTPSTGYTTAVKAGHDISYYLMQRYNSMRPLQFNGGLAPAVAEEKLNAAFGVR